MATVNAYGASRTLYLHHVALISDPWQKVPVNYMFARLGIGGWFVAYIGESDNAYFRLPTHERWAEAVRDHGCTHVLNHVGHGDQSLRRAEECDLIRAINPPMNTHHTSDAQSDVLSAWNYLMPRK